MKKHSLSQDNDSSVASDNPVIEIPIGKKTDKENIEKWMITLVAHFAYMESVSSSQFFFSYCVVKIPQIFIPEQTLNQ